MGVFSFLPKLNRCCYCTRNLRVASVLIVIWSMGAALGTIYIIMHPTCKDQYDKGSGPLYMALIIFKWILYGLSLGILGSSFAFLIGIFLPRPITADVFMGVGMVSAICSFFFAIFCLVQMIFAKCAFNTNDVLWFLLTCALWIYYIIIVNSYRESLSS